MDRSRKLIAAVAALVASTWAMPALAQAQATANVAQKRMVTIEGRSLADWIAALKDKDPAVRKRAAVVLGDVPRAQAGTELIPLQAAIKGVMFGDRDREVREAATAALLKLSRSVEEWQRVDGRYVIVRPTVLRLVDTQGRPIAGAVVGTHFNRDGDRDSPFTPTEGTESQISDEQGEASMKFSIPRPGGVMGVYAIRPAGDRPLVGIAEFSREQIGKPATIVMYPACRVRLRVECPGFRELGTKYRAELDGPNWTRSAYLWPGNAVRSLYLSNTGSTSGELEFLLPPGRYTIVAFGADTNRASRSVEIPPGHRVRSLGIVEVTPSRQVQQGTFFDLWRSGPAVPLDELDGDATENRPIFRRPRLGPLLKGKTQGIRDLAFSPDGKLLATAHGYNDGPGGVKLWDVRTGEPAATLSLPSVLGEAAVHRLAFSPDGKALAGAAGSMHNLQSPSSIVLWDFAPRWALRVLEGQAASITTLAFAPDGRTLASGGADRTVRFWDVATGRETGRFEVDPEWPEAIAYAPDGKALAVASGEALKLWDLPGNRLRATLETDGFPAQSLAFSPDGQSLAAAGMTLRPQEGKVRLYDLTRQPPTRRVDLTHDGQPPAVPVPSFSDVAFTPDGCRVVAIAASKIAIWGTATGVELESLEGGITSNRLDVSPDGRWLAVAQGQVARLIEVPRPAAPGR